MKRFEALLEEYLLLTKERILNFEKFNNYSHVHHSNSIEGSQLTLSETILLVDKKLTPNGKPLNNTFMAIDHYEALIYILDLAKDKQKISSESLKKVSSLIMKNTGTT